MHTNINQKDGLFSLLNSLDAMTNKRAFLALAIAALIGLVSISVVGYLFTEYGYWNSIFAKVLGIITALVFLAGISAGGFLLMDQTRGNEIRSISDAYLMAIFTLPRLLGLILTQALIFLGLIISITLLLFVCKIPGIGPALYTFVFPIASALSGIIVAGLAYVFTSLALPCLWTGCTYREVLARLWEITKQRLVLVILMLMILVFLTGFVSFVISGIAIGGMGIVGGLSASILDISFSSINALANMFNGNYGGGYLASGLFGVSLMFAAIAALTVMVYLKGLCHIYLKASDGLEFSAAEIALAARAEELKKRAREAQKLAKESLEKTREAANKASNKANEVNTATELDAEPVVEVSKQKLECSACKEPIAKDDMFCEHCGFKQE